MSDQKNEIPVNGLILIGKVNAKSMRQYKNGDEHFFLSIAAPAAKSCSGLKSNPKTGALIKKAHPSNPG